VATEQIGQLVVNMTDCLVTSIHVHV